MVSPLGVSFSPINPQETDDDLARLLDRLVGAGSGSLGRLPRPRFAGAIDVTDPIFQFILNGSVPADGAMPLGAGSAQSPSVADFVGSQSPDVLEAPPEVEPTAPITPGEGQAPTLEDEGISPDSAPVPGVEAPAEQEGDVPDLSPEDIASVEQVQQETAPYGGAGPFVMPGWEGDIIGPTAPAEQEGDAASVGGSDVGGGVGESYQPEPPASDAPYFSEEFGGLPGMGEPGSVEEIADETGRYGGPGPFVMPGWEGDIIGPTASNDGSMLGPSEAAYEAPSAGGDTNYDDILEALRGFGWM